jgi:hypothetical protein
MTAARRVTIVTGDRRETVRLSTYLDAALAERAAVEANRWIKALRLLDVDGVPLRDRFRYRGDSLWWFAELYLHKQGVIDALWQTALALDALCTREPRPLAIEIEEAHAADPILRQLAPHIAARHGIACRVAAGADRSSPTKSRLALDLKSRFYTWSAFASRLRGSRAPRATRASTSQASASPRGAVAFVHSAFWRKSQSADAKEDEGYEGYIGAVLRELQTRQDAQPVTLVGVGPRTNFKARRWWHAIAPSHAGAGEIPVEPIEQFASWDALEGSRAIWRERFAMERALLASDAIHAHARMLDCDVWPIVAEELRGVARLQFAWSVRAMDEAAAAMETLNPRLIVTYAEAGGWGRALMLEARRRGIASIGLQHGFIYRHWLNYLHEPDEMSPSPTNPTDQGFPRPDLTLVYDGYAARHLTTAGHFPTHALRITGSPALDALAAAVARIDDIERTNIRQHLGISRDDRLIVLVTKFTQIGDALPPLLRAIASLKGVRLIIKPHPAETADAYHTAVAAAAATNTIIAPPSLDLAKLLAVARLVVTVNSTVAIDAMTLGIPSLIVNLPNNLTPFVTAGVMADGSDTAHLPTIIDDLLHNNARRTDLLTRARAFATDHAIHSDGHAAERAVDAMFERQASSQLQS